MEKKFTNEQTQKMYAILVEIHSTLKDKSKNTMPRNLNVCEVGWLVGIEELLEKIEKSTENGK